MIDTGRDAAELSTDELTLIETRLNNERKSVVAAYLLFLFLGGFGIHTIVHHPCKVRFHTPETSMHYRGLRDSHPLPKPRVAGSSPVSRSRNPEGPRTLVAGALALGS